MGKGLEALKRELRRLESELSSTPLPAEGIDHADEELDTWLMNAVADGALPPRSDEEIKGLEHTLLKVTVPLRVVDRMRDRWQGFIKRATDPSGPVASATFRAAVAFRKGEAEISSEDRQAVSEAVERMRRQLRERNKK